MYSVNNKEIPVSASQEEIRSAFLKLSRKYHPDRSREAGAKARFEQINVGIHLL